MKKKTVTLQIGLATVTMRMFLKIAIVMLALTLGNVAYGQLQWRETNRDIPKRSLTDPRVTDGIEIYGYNGVIYIKTPRRIAVRVFTILGQNVSQATLNPGTHELKIGSRGIYIVKIGNLTQKVAL